jgi:hypothetical protein
MMTSLLESIGYVGWVLHALIWLPILGVGLVLWGEEEVANRTVAIRDRRRKEQYNLSQEDFMLQLSQQLNEGTI